MLKFILRRGLYFFISFALLFVLSESSFATGLSKSVTVGPKAIGMGGAFTGIADDPTAIYHNPAGITQIEGHALEFGFDGLATDLDYTPPGGAPTEKADVEFLPVPRFFYVNNMLPVSLGIGMYFPHGNGGQFPGPSAVPTNPTEGRIYSMEIAPAVAWQAAEWLSLGATLRIVRIESSLKGQLVPVGPATFVTLDDLDVSGWTVGASAGVLAKPSKYLSVGVTYRSELNDTLKGTADVTSAAGSATDLDASIKQKLPMLLMVGLGSKPIDRLTVGLGYSFEQNASIENLTGTIDTLGTLTLPQNWGNSHTVHFGLEFYVLPEKLAARFGYAQDINRSIPDSVMNRVIGDIASKEISVGLAYRWKQFLLQGTWNARSGERTVANNGANPGPGFYEAFVQSFSFGLGIDL